MKLRRSAFVAMVLAANMVAIAEVPARPVASKAVVKKKASKVVVRKRRTKATLAPKKKPAPAKAVAASGGGSAPPVSEDPNDWKVSVKIHYGPGK